MAGRSQSVWCNGEISMTLFDHVFRDGCYWLVEPVFEVAINRRNIVLFRSLSNGLNLQKLMQHFS